MAIQNEIIKLLEKLQKDVDAINARTNETITYVNTHIDADEQILAKLNADLQAYKNEFTQKYNSAIETLDTLEESIQNIENKLCSYEYIEVEDDE